MSSVDHDDISSLNQHYICVEYELDRLKKRYPDFKNGKKLSKCIKDIVNISKDIVDKNIVEGGKVNEPSVSRDSVFWAQVVTGVILLVIGVSLGIGYIAIQNLESAVFHGDYSYQPKESK